MALGQPERGIAELHTALDGKGTHQWLMAGRLAEGKAEIALAKGDHAEAS
jgi:hypothetical protein